MNNIVNKTSAWWQPAGAVTLHKQYVATKMLTTLTYHNRKGEWSGGSFARIVLCQQEK